MSLVVKNLSKTYKEHAVVDHVSFEIEENKIYGLLGRNGAGKSTTLNMIAHRINKGNGEILLDGQSLWDTQACMSQVYLTSDDNWFYPEDKVIKIYKALEVLYGSFDWDLANDLIRAYELNTKKKLKALSTGYASIAKIIAALCVPCRYIFLDEPVLGLDANHRKLFYKKLLQTYADKPRTFVISTHIIEEIAYLLESVIIIDKGKIVVADSVENLLATGKLVSGPKDIVQAFTKNMTILSTEMLGNHIQVSVSGEWNGEIPENVVIEPITLQDYFISITKRAGE